MNRHWPHILWRYLHPTCVIAAGRGPHVARASRPPSGASSARTQRILLFLLSLLVLASGSYAQLPDIPPVPSAPVNGLLPEKPLLEPRQKAALIRLGGPVDDIMLQSIQRRVTLARQQGCDLIIYEIDSYGGQLTSALDISRYTKTLARTLPVVAYVNTKAISAGAIIAFSCQHVVVAPSSAIGDCMPIAVSGDQAHAIEPGLMPKVTSPLLEELRDSAQKNHYPYLMLEAMVIRETEVWALRNNVDVNAPPLYVSDTEKDAKLKALNKLPDGSQGNTWVLDPKPIDSNNTLLTVTATEAVSYGLARAEVGSEAQLRALYNIRGDVISMDYSWSENAVRWLSNDYVRMGLFITMLVLAYLEFTHPGISVPGIGAVICLVLLVGAPYMTGLAQVWEIILITLGAAIIIVDLLLYGGVGLLAVPGFILMAIGLVASFVPADPGGGYIPQTAQWYTGLQHGLAVIIFGSLGALAIFYFLSRYLYLTPGFRRLQLVPAVPTLPAAAVHDATDQSAGEAVFVGALGQAVSDLRPAGKVRFDGHLIDAVSQGQFIPEGATVIVIEATAYHVLVKPVPSTQPASGGDAK